MKSYKSIGPMVGAGLAIFAWVVSSMSIKIIHTEVTIAQVLLFLSDIIPFYYFFRLIYNNLKVQANIILEQVLLILISISILLLFYFIAFRYVFSSDINKIVSKFGYSFVTFVFIFIVSRIIKNRNLK